MKVYVVTMVLVEPYEGDQVSVDSVFNSKEGAHKYALARTQASSPDTRYDVEEFEVYE